MPASDAKPQFGGEWVNRISDMLGSPDKNLDQVKKSVKADLEKIKKGTDVAINLYLTAEAGFKKDLDEVAISGDAQKPYLEMFKAEWAKMEMGKKSEEILGSPELAAMDAFITSVQNLPKLKEVIDSVEPQANWQTMLKGFASRIPGLSEFIDKGGFDTVLTSLGLGFLVKPKKAKDTQQGSQVAAAEGKKGDEKSKPAEASEGVEVVPESFKPGKTLVMGDSNFNAFADAPGKVFRDKLNITGTITKGGEQSGWGLTQIKEKPKEYFQDFENVAIGFGTNDMGTEDSADKIWGRLKEMAQIIKEKNPKIKIFIATIPPGKGNPYGQWGSNFESVEERRIGKYGVNEKIKAAKRDGLIAGVIDLAAPKSKGGLADDNDPHSLATEVRRFGDDKVHAKAEVLADAILKAEYRESKEAKS